MDTGLKYGRRLHGHALPATGLLLCMLLAPCASAGFTVDHTCTDAAEIPQAWIDTVKDGWKLHYAHTSHGSQLISGAQVLETQDTNFNIAVGYSSLPATAGALCIFDGQESDTYITPDEYWQTESGMNQVRAVLDNNPSINVSMWSWCGQVSSASEGYIQTYLTNIAQLASGYPEVTFVYMTGHLDGTGTNGNLHLRNNQIRAWCAAQDAVLYDFADIERFDPDGSDYLALNADDNCDYNGGNWATEWCAAHPENDLCASCSCAHSQSLNCGLKGRAFWHLMARIAGWQSDPGPDFSIHDITLSRDAIVWSEILPEKPSVDDEGRQRPQRIERKDYAAPPAADNHYQDAVFTASVTVSNQGSVSGDAGRLSVWVDQAASVSCGAAGDASTAIGTLDAGQSTQIVFTGLAAGTDAGLRTFRAFADSNCETTEQREGNNQAVYSYSVLDPVPLQFAAQPRTNSIVLHWTQPYLSGLSNDTVLIRWHADTYPASTNDGTTLYTGTNTHASHSGLVPGQTYYYRIWVSHDGTHMFDPPEGTNTATACPHLIPANMLLRCSHTFTQGGREKTACRSILYNDTGTGCIATGALPASFNLATRWTIAGSGNFNPAMPGDEVLISNPGGALYLLYMDYTGALDWDDNTNSVYWTSWNAQSDYTTNASEWSIDAIGDVNGDGQDEAILRAGNTFQEGGKTKSRVKILFYDPDGSGTLSGTQPEGFTLATRWTIQGMGRFNTASPNSSDRSEQLLLQHNSEGGYYLLYFTDNGNLYWNSEDTNDICWTSWSAGSSFSTNAPAWSTAAIGDINGDGQDEILAQCRDTFVQGGKTKSRCRVLYFTDNGSGRLRANQPDSFALATRWSIQGLANFNTTNSISAPRAHQLLIRHTTEGGYYLLYFEPDGTLYWNSADTNDICWTSWSAGNSFSTNAPAWSVQTIGDFTGSRE